MPVLPEPEPCPSCGSILRERHCSACGELRLALRHFSLREFAKDTLESATDVDGKLLGTLRALVRQPGLLTAEFMRGARQPYVGPFKLFLLANVVFFAVASLTGSEMFSTSLYSQLHHHPYSDLVRGAVEAEAASRGRNLSTLHAEFNPATRTLAKTFIFVLVPLFAMACSVVLPRVKWFVERLAFALHVFAWLLLTVSVLNAPWWIATRARWGTWQTRDAVTTVVLAVFLVTWQYAALRRLYGLRRIEAAVRALLLLVAFVCLLFGYRFLLLWLTLFWLRLTS